MKTSKIEYPKLSVIMTVYNGETFLQETLDAVFAQSYASFEFVIVNNASTDGTQAILDAVDDDRMRVVQAQIHGTFGDGIRLAYKNACGQYIAVQDADDISFPDRFKKQVAALDADRQLGIVSSSFENIDQDGKHIGYSYPPEDLQDLVDSFQTSNPLAHSSYMYRKIASDAVGGYPVQHAYGPDFGLVLRLVQFGWRVQVLTEVLLKLRQHAGQASLATNLGVTRAHDAYYLFTEASKLEGASVLSRKLGKRNLTKRRIRYALDLLGSGHVFSGARYLSLALFTQPLYGIVFLSYSLPIRLTHTPTRDRFMCVKRILSHGRSS